MATMKITEFTDRKQVMEFLEMFEGDLRAVCDKYGVTYVRDKASYSSKALTLKYELRPVDSPFSETEHSRADNFATSRGIAFGEHFIGSEYQVYFKRRLHIATVTGIKYSARKYTVQIRLDDGTVALTSAELLKGKYTGKSDTASLVAIRTYLSYTYEDDTMTDEQINAWDAVDASVACLVNREKEPHFYELLDDIAEHHWKHFSKDAQDGLVHALHSFIGRSITSDEVVRRFEKAISHEYPF